jgi:Acetyltransferase (GNAT) domain
MPMRRENAGYAHPLYARASESQGTAFKLPRSGGWLLRRVVPGRRYEDATGPYPLFACRDWAELPFDIDALGDDLVSIVLVADPFADNSDVLKRSFPHLRRFKEHFVVELSRFQGPTPHHRRDARRALREVTVERCDPPAAFLDDWLGLYRQLIERHAIEGPATFSSGSFRTQFDVPGLVVFRASQNGRTVAMALWLIQDPVAYYHLAASNQAGYRTGASYALMWHAIENFRGRVEWLDLGGVPGLSDSAAGGLRSFKEGWSTGSRWAYLCGRVLNEERYAALAARSMKPSDRTYFPAYRDPRAGLEP